MSSHKSLEGVIITSSIILFKRKGPLDIEEAFNVFVVSQRSVVFQVANVIMYIHHSIKD